MDEIIFKINLIIKRNFKKIKKLKICKKIKFF